MQQQMPRIVFHYLHCGMINELDPKGTEKGKEERERKKNKKAEEKNTKKLKKIEEVNKSKQQMAKKVKERGEKKWETKRMDECEEILNLYVLSYILTIKLT